MLIELKVHSEFGHDRVIGEDLASQLAINRELLESATLRHWQATVLADLLDQLFELFLTLRLLVFGGQVNVE